MQGDPILPPVFRNALRDYSAGYMAARNLAARSRVEYETDVTQFLQFLHKLKVHELRHISPRHLEAYLANLDREGLAGVTRRKKSTILRTFFNWLRRNGRVAANPAMSASPPQREEKEPRVLSRSEYERLLAAVQKPRDRAIIQLLLQTGIRLSEIVRLTLSDLELPRRITRDALGTARILGKGRKTRTVLLNAKACEAPLTWLGRRPTVGSDALFASSRLRTLSPRQYEYFEGKYLYVAGIRNAGVHTLRHTFATHHIAMGTDLITVQEFLGHRSLDTTKLYIRLAKKRLAQHIQEHAL